MSSIEKVWSAYKVNPASEALYTDDVFVVYLPTSAGGRGLGDVVRFYSQQDFIPSINVVKETVHKKIVSEDAVVEEVEWSVTFTSGECSWLLPNLDKSHLIEATVIFPAVISASFSAGKISSIRIYWDQGGLLKQLKIIGERQRWPIRGIEQIDALRKPHMLQLNPFGRGSEAAGGHLAPSSSLGSSKNGTQEPKKKHPMSSNIFDAEPEPQRLSSRVNQPGGTGGKSRIFDEDAPLSGQRRTTGKGILPGFDEPDPVPARSPPRRTTGRNILPGFDDDDEPVPHRPSTRANQQPGSIGGRSRIFDDTPPNSPPRRMPAKGILPEELSPSSPPTGRPFAGKSNQSTVFDEQPVDMSSSISGSTRRANTTTNQSQLSFSEIDEHLQREAQQRREERAAAAAAAAADTNANATLSPSISSTTTASDSSSRASRRQNAAKNDSHFSFSDEETGPSESLSASGRKYSSRSNTSSFSFGAEETPTSLSGSTKGRSKAVFNESQLDKDTSNDGDYRKYITPSSRVLKAPGGGSSITFG